MIISRFQVSLACLFALCPLGAAHARTQHSSQPKTNPKPVPSTHTLGLSSKAITAFIDDDLTFHKVASVNGLPTSVGVTKDETAHLDLVGDPANITRVTLEILLPKDDENARITNTAILIRVMMNTSPGWQDNVKWLTNAVGQVCKEPDHKAAEIVRDHRHFTLAYLKEVGMALTVTHD